MEAVHSWCFLWMCLYNLGRHHDHHNYHLNQMGPSMLKNPLEIVEDNLHYQYHHDQWSLTIIISINDGPSLSYSKSKGTFYDGESSENSRRRPPQQVRWQPALQAPCLQLIREHIFKESVLWWIVFMFNHILNKHLWKEGKMVTSGIPLIRWSR